MTAIAKRPPVHRMHRWVLPAILCCLLLAGYVGFRLLQADHERARQTALAEYEAHARVGVQAAFQLSRRLLDHVDTIHSMAQIAWKERLSGAEMEHGPIRRQLRQLARSGVSGILQIAVIGPDGIVEWSTADNWQPLDLTDREHFRVHRDGRLAPFVSEPLLGRISNRTSVQLTRPLLDRTGAFAGVVVVSVDPELLGATLRSLHWRGEGVSALVRSEGQIIARSVLIDPSRERSFSADVVRAWSTADIGAGHRISQWTAQPMVFAWQRMHDWPLVIVHAEQPQQLNQQMDERWNRRMGLFGLTGAVVLGCAMIIVLLSSRHQVQKRMREAASARDSFAVMLADMPGAAYAVYPNDDGRGAADFSSALVRLTDAMHPIADATCDAHAEVVRLALAQGYAELEYRAQRADGQWIWIRDQLRASTAGLSDIQFVGLLTDITESRTMAANIAAGAKLAHLGEMAAGIAHELNQPATSIALAADIAQLQLEHLPATQTKGPLARLANITQQTMRMREIINHLLAFSRHESHETVLEAVDLREVVHGALLLAGGPLHAAGAVVEQELQPNLPQVRGDELQLEQVLSNLLGNAQHAVRHLPPAQRRVLIRAYADPADAHCMLEVHDSGSGFGPEERSRAFEPFYTTKSPGEGTGLGLSICHGIVTRFGGKIDILDSPLGGAALRVTLIAAELSATVNQPMDLRMTR